MQIAFNGKTYNSLEEMPPNERQAYDQLRKIFVDANGNGIPDFLEGDVAQKVITAFTKQFNYGGQVYNNLDQLPPEARQKVQAAFTKLQQMGLISPEIAGQISPKPSDFEYAFQPSSPLIQKEPAIQASSRKGTGTAILVAILILLIGCGMAAAILLFARG